MIPSAQPCRHGRLGIAFVVKTKVIHDFLAFLEHALHAVANDGRHFVGEGGIINVKSRDGGGEERRMAVLVLQPLAVEGGAAGSGAEQKALGPAVARQPEFIAHPLRAEHGVVYVEGNQIDAVVGVGRSRRDKRRHRAGFGDAFLQNLAVLGFVVEAEAGLLVHRLVKLALGRIDADLAEERINPEGARFVGNNRHDAPAHLRVPRQHGQEADKTLGGGSLPGAGAAAPIPGTPPGAASGAARP